MTITAEQIAVANATSRNNGAVGAKALVPRYVRDHYGALTDIMVLDFGAGREAAHAEAMREAYSTVHGWQVDAYEFGVNRNERHLSESQAVGMLGLYGVVYASNVLNVQSSYEMMHNTLHRVKSFMNPVGHFICNLPESPRKMSTSADNVEEVLRVYFATVERVAGTKRAPVWRCTNWGTV